MHYCPNCSAQLAQTSAGSCWNCGALFEGASAWKPVTEPSGPFRPFAKKKTSRGDEALTRLATQADPVGWVHLRLFCACIPWVLIAGVALASVILPDADSQGVVMEQRVDASPRS
jgi:hypothetical protein